MGIKLSIKAGWLSAVFLMTPAGHSLAGNTPGGEAASVNEEPEVCKDPRPQMCTMDYRPVCGTMTGGEKKTYSNGCSACSDMSVLSYVPGECPE